MKHDLVILGELARLIKCPIGLECKVKENSNIKL